MSATSRKYGGVATNKEVFRVRPPSVIGEGEAYACLVRVARKQHLFLVSGSPVLCLLSCRTVNGEPTRQVLLVHFISHNFFCRIKSVQYGFTWRCFFFSFES